MPLLLSFCLLAYLFRPWILQGSFLRLSLRLPLLSLLLLQFLIVFLVFLRFHFECHFLFLFFCTGCSFHFVGCNFHFHSLFLKNGSPHGDKFSSCDFSLAFLLCLTSIYVESVFVTRDIIGSFLSFSDGVWSLAAISSERSVFWCRILAIFSPSILFWPCLLRTSYSSRSVTWNG